MIKRLFAAAFLAGSASIVCGETITWGPAESTAEGSVAVIQDHVGTQSGSELVATHVAVPQFDSALGVLESVDFDFSFEGRFDTSVTTQPLPFGQITRVLKGETQSTIESGYRFALSEDTIDFSPKDRAISDRFWINHPNRSTTSARQRITLDESRSFRENLDAFIGTDFLEVSIFSDLDLELDVLDFGGDHAITEAELAGMFTASTTVTYTYAAATSHQPKPEVGPIQWRVDEGGNGHYYELVKDVLNPSTFFEAKDAAEASAYVGVPGQLVSITSREEHDFVLNNVYDGDIAWIGLTDSELFGGMESLLKPNREVDGWVWLDGEPVAYANWHPGEPNNGDGEDAVIMNGIRGQWQDNGFGREWAYIIEYAVPPETNKDCNEDGNIDILDANCIENDNLDSFLSGIGSLRGDFDGDGEVAFADFFALADSFGDAASYTKGDFDKDGDVTFDDFISFSNAFGSSARASAVPEPASHALTLLMAVCAIVRRHSVPYRFIESRRLS